MTTPSESRSRPVAGSAEDADGAEPATGSLVADSRTTPTAAGDRRPLLVRAGISRTALLDLRGWLAAARWVVVALGVALRVRQWLGDRSFWTDEQALWLAVHDRDLGELARPLRLAQAAPIGWLWVQHGAMAALGNGERAARLVPLLFGCGALVLSAVLARRVLGPAAALVATTLVAFSPLLVYYSNEFKQYSSDVFWSVLLVLLGVVLAEQEVLRRRSAAALGLTLAIGVWFSHAAVLTGPGVLAALGLLALCGRQWRRLALLVAAAVPLLASIGVNYAVALSKTAHNPGLKNFWQVGFPPRPIRARGVAEWALDSVPRLLDRPLSLPHPGVAVPLLVAGLGVLAVRRPRVLLVLLMPLAVVFAAAVLRLYPAADRLVLFVVPTVLVILAAPVDLLRRHRTPARTALSAALAAAAVAGLTVLATPSLQQAADHAVHPQEVEETRPVLAYIAQRIRPGDLVLFDTTIYPELVYGPEVGLSRSVLRLVTKPAPGCRPGAAEAVLRQRYRRVWLAWGHQFTRLPPITRDGYRAHLATVGRRVDSVRATGAGTDLYDLTLPPDDPKGTSPVLRMAEARCLTVHGL